MKYLEQEEINKLANTFLLAKESLIQTKSLKEKQEYLQQQNLCIQRLRFLIANKIGKYKQFSNYADLEQDGFEALLLALKTYNPQKGCFSWWADKYISTRISRAANTHSTIRFPLKKAKETRPFKTNIIPIIADWAPNAQEILENSERYRTLAQAINQLPEMHKTIICMIYGFNGKKPNTMQTIVKELAISRSQGSKILREAKNQLKEFFTNRRLFESSQSLY